MIDGEDLQLVSTVFRVYEVREAGDDTYLLGEPQAEGAAMSAALEGHFAKKGKAVTAVYRLGEMALVISPFKKERVWINVVLALATLLSTTLIGAMMSGVDPLAAPLDLYKGLPFAAAIMLVLGSHELGHYFVSRLYGIRASLPYFIPFPFSPIGTMGAIIVQKGPVPSRKALFDVGIAGPLVGLIVSVIVTIIGLLLPAPQIDPALTGSYLQLQTPLLFDFLDWVLHPGTPLTGINPIAFAGWVGMLVTVLNMIPVGQLDGGHVFRAVFGKFADHLSKVMPLALLSFGLVGTFYLNQPGEIWIFWGLLTGLMGSSAHPSPTDDTQKIGLPRYLLAAVTIVLTILCFTPFPISMG